MQPNISKDQFNKLNYGQEYPFNMNIADFDVFKKDPHLIHFRKHFEVRNQRYKDVFDDICKNQGGLLNFSRSYENFGIVPKEDGILIREWLPGAKDVLVCGDFNGWNRGSHRLKRNEYGVWELFLAKKENGEQQIPHLSKIKLHIQGADGQYKDKNSAWIRYSIQQEDNSYCGIMWNPAKRYEFINPLPNRHSNPKIYECHVGMSGLEEKVHTYKDFTKYMLPRIKKQGYNVIQIMALMEHSYYGSFGYHVTNFFAASSRYGTPDDLKELIDTAHGLGIMVLMDLVHSHASSNAQDGIYLLDGTDHQYFHGGAKGHHSLWDSKVFNYGKVEVMRFLLSNLAWYMEEYKFDGFRFDGVTSMLYMHHGIAKSFSGSYHEYFSEWTDLDSLAYLMLANTLIHRINPQAITIAEDVSGMPTLGSPVKDGGVGFDFRLAMAIPDKFIELLKKYKDDDWDVKNLTWTLLNRRYDENVIAYAESHDQAIVGDKTISMWLFDAEVYWNMSLNKQETLCVNRGMALHKMLRLITLAMGGDAYLNFMGNEWGHPEWIDFPRQGNNWSYHHCRRRWDLADDQTLRFKFLNNFDKEMLRIEQEFKFLKYKENYLSLAHVDDKVICFERGGVVFVFNFHPCKSFTDYKIGTNYPYNHIIILDTDEQQFGGQERLRHGHNNAFPILNEPWNNRSHSIKVYLPARTALVLKPIMTQPIENQEKKEEEEQCKERSQSVSMIEKLQVAEKIIVTENKQQEEKKYQNQE